MFTAIKDEWKKLPSPSNKSLGVFIALWAVVLVYAAYKFDTAVSRLVCAAVLLAEILLWIFNKRFVKTLYGYWMFLAVILGFFVNKIILSIMFYLFLTPIGFVVRLFKKDLLDISILPNAKSYWTEKKRLTDEEFKQSFKRMY